MASAFSDNLMPSRGWKHPPKISKTTKAITMKFLPRVGNYKKAQNRNFIFDLSVLVFRLQTKIPKIPILGNVFSRHANVTKFCRIVHIEVKNEY